jgi:hypothetical protein
MAYESDDGAQAKVQIPIPFMRRGQQVPVRVGDAVKRGTNALGFKQCGGCKERQRRWNQWLAFYGTRGR